MKTIIEKIKFIAIILTLLNIGIGIVGFYQNLPLAINLALFFVIELLVLFVYLLVVTYRWIDEVQKKTSEIQIAEQYTLQSKIDSFETSFDKMRNEVGEEIRSKYRETAIAVESAGKFTSIKFEELSRNIFSIKQEIGSQIDKKSIEKVAIEKEFKQLLIEKFSAIIFLQEGLRDQINEKSLDQNSTQQDTLNMVDEKINNILFTQQGVNKMLEDNSQNTIKLSSEIIKVVEKRATNINANLTTQLNVTYDRLDALMSIHNVIELNAPLPIMHDWRVSSDFAHATLSTLLEVGSGSVIDIGSGISTLLFGYGVKKNGSGKVISLEHSQEYFEKSKALIKAHQLEEYCELYFCPLKEYSLDGKTWLWYDIEKVVFPKDVTLVCVDGPPGSTQYMSRYPAIPILQKEINSNTIVFLDDGKREEEEEIAKKWKEVFKMKIEEIDAHKGIFKLFF